MRVAFISPINPAACAVPPSLRDALVAALRSIGHSAEIVTPYAWRSLDAATRFVVETAAIPSLTDDIDMLVARHVVAFVEHPATLDATDGGTPMALRVLSKGLLGPFERVIVTSGGIAERLRADFDVAAEAITVVAPGIDERVRSPGSGGPGCAILSIGALVPSAKHDELLRALARLFDLDWHLTVVGDDALDRVHAQTLAALVDELGVANRVVFPGEVAPAELEALWRGTDLFADVGRQDGYAMTTAESLRRGVPLAIVAGGDAAKLVSAEAGAVCPPGDRDTLSKSLRRLIFDTALRRDMSEAAWKIGQGLHDWPTQARAFAEALAI